MKTKPRKSLPAHQPKMFSTYIRHQAKKKEFIAFLKEHNALIPFIINLHKSKWFLFHRYEKYNPTSLVYSSFHWDETTEGFSYWSNINIQWQKRLENTWG